LKRLIFIRRCRAQGCIWRKQQFGHHKLQQSGTTSTGSADNHVHLYQVLIIKSDIQLDTDVAPFVARKTIREDVKFKVTHMQPPTLVTE
jgi:hypothetical protein